MQQVTRGPSEIPPHSQTPPTPPTPKSPPGTPIPQVPSESSSNTPSPHPELTFQAGELEPHVFILSAGSSSPAPPPALAAGAGKERRGLRETILGGRRKEQELKAHISPCVSGATGARAPQETRLLAHKTTSDVMALQRLNLLRWGSGRTFWEGEEGACYWVRAPIPASPFLGSGLKIFWDEDVVSSRNWVGF